MTSRQHAAGIKAAVDTIFGLTGQAFEGAQRLTALNLQTLKILLAESQENSWIAVSTGRWQH
ncbi:MAG: hypothetical protein JWQ03_3040 [Variovorax sp.]|nr:hypothetical protein [Variovorax sp.]